jgi:thioredoxin 1
MKKGLVIFVILVGIGTIFLIKNLNDNASATTDGVKNSEKGSSVDPLYLKAEFDLNATEVFDLAELLAYKMPLVVDFGADTCVPCKEMAPVLAELNQSLRGKAVVKFVDVWKNAAAGQDLPIRVIPTQFFFNADGTPYLPGDQAAAEKNGFILYNHKDTGEHMLTAHEGGLSKEQLLAVMEEMGIND